MVVATIASRLRSVFRHDSNDQQTEIGDEGNTSEKGGRKMIVKDVDEPEADRILEPGELTFEDDAKGGLGRHLGLFSTTLLMYAVP
jgi:hypothetical protein